MSLQGTLVGILSCCCNEGDIEGATKILDQMRSLDMEINENIYASLITGHCRRGDMENGEGMLKVMQENGLCPTATSYAALLCGHADRGDMDRVEQLLEEMRERRVFPSVGVYSSLLDRLSLSGHSDLLPRALDVVPDKQLLYNDLYDQACKCTVRRDNKGTLIMLRCLATLVPRTTNIQLGAILIRTMASQGRMLSEMMVMVAELQSLEFGHHVYEEILHSLHTRHDDRDQAMADALSVLQDMPRHGVVVKEHYFYPNLAYYAEKGDLEGAVRGVALMKEAGLKLRRMSFRYLLQASREGGVASESDDVIGDMDRLLAHIKGTPLMLNLVNEISVFLLDRGMFARAVELLTSVTSEPIDLGPILKAIKNGVNHSKVVDVPGLVSVYVALHSLPSNPDLSRSVAITTSILVQTSPDLAKQFIEELSGNGVDPGEHAYHTLLHSYATPDTVKEFHAMMKCLQSRGMVLRPSIHKQMLELAADMGDPVRAGQAVSAIRRSGQRLSATAFSRYIVANAKSRRIGTALELYERMRSHDLRPSYEAMNHLMVELLRWGDVHGAENMRRY
jgi:pentatricopeptide repeat protein